MNLTSKRRKLLLAAAAAPALFLISGCVGVRPATPPVAAGNKKANKALDAAFNKLAALEKASGGRLGVAAMDAGQNGFPLDMLLGYRYDERFPMCSTFKLLAAAAILRRSEQDVRLLQQRIAYVQADLVAYSPITEKHIAGGMTIAELCAATLQYSDNTAANLLLKTLGGPAAITEFSRSLGDRETRLDRWETELNTAIPGDPRDTTTPVAMMFNMQKLILGEALSPSQREQLQVWLKGNTTGGTRIRAGVPANWQVGDKTGSGAYGATNDIAVLWPPTRPPILLTIYYVQDQQDAENRSEVLAAATRIVVEAFA
ncbi:class A beta-lactamase [Undibacterium terreum]|uniref:class A beta-lactamase n=1 Tax=Undibacterium terreum TaxID=1224302 RepID=UPI00166B5F59|nr:class A beta-lactamase [Undibacterium terreum]